MRTSTCCIRSSAGTRAAFAVTLALVALSLTPPDGAHAAVSVTGFNLQPSTAQAAGHPALTLSASFALNPPSDDLKSFTVVLPQGLIGDPAAADACSQAEFAGDACPPGSKLGTSETAITITTAGTDVPQTAAGTVYNLRPLGAEPARLGIVVRPSAVNSVSLPKIFLQSPVTVGPQTNYGLSTTFDGIPRSAGPFDIRVTGVTLSLAGSAAHGPFLTNPTDCASATGTATAASYDAPGSSTRAASFTPLGCGGLAFTPALAGTVAGAGQTAAAAHPTLATEIAFDAGQANARTVKVILPRSLSTSLAQVNRACDQDLLPQGGCPPGATVGSAVATSPLLPGVLSAPVVLTRAPSSGLPALSVQFRGSVPLLLRGQTGFDGPLLTTTFDGLPDLPISSFGLTIAGGPGGLLANIGDLCSRAAQTALKVELTAHSGRAVTIGTPLTVLGCRGGAGRARGRASLALRATHGVGTLTGTLSPPRSAPRLREARIVLPRGLRASVRYLRVTAGGKPLARSHFHVRNRTLDIRPPGAGATRLVLRWTHIRTRSGRARLRFAVRLTDLVGYATTAHVVVRPVIGRAR